MEVMMKRLCVFLFVVCIIPVFAQEKKIKVVTTLGVLKYLAQEIGKQKVDVYALAQPKQDPHYVIPTPELIRIARDADVFIKIGMKLDRWAKNVIDASGNPKIQVGQCGHIIASLNVPKLELPQQVSREWGDIHPEGNPHIWLSPVNVRIIAKNIADGLSKVDPSNSRFYQKNFEEFKRKIDVALFGEELLKKFGKRGGDILCRKLRYKTLERYLKRKKVLDKLGGWLKKAEKLKGMKVLSYHKTYIYFADVFGLEIVGEIEEKPGIPPSPKRRDKIVEIVKQNKVKILLNDNFYSRKAADYIASKTGAKVVITYIDVGASREVSDYFGLINYLIKRILEAVK
jgi:ABC-type Zn uptake system ZnuABC Zn-binding protein ZnuA